MLKNIFYLIQNLIDYGYKKKIKKFFNTELKSNNLDVIIDVGAHKGETINFFSSFLNVKNFYCYEASKKNFEDLKKKISEKKNIYIYNIGLGDEENYKKLNESVESQSSTFNQINLDANYTKRKIKYLKFFFNSEKLIESNSTVLIRKLSDEIYKNKINIIDILKIDTEGYEFKVIKGLDDCIKKVNYIYFEHHFDQTIEKQYNLSDIHNYLKSNNFSKVFKVKMPMRKVFDYIYRNNKI